MQLMYDKGERNYEDEGAYGATIDDVDMNAVNEYIKIIGYSKSALEYLYENNDFVKEADGRQKVSNACILLFGKRPQRFSHVPEQDSSDMKELRKRLVRK